MSGAALIRGPKEEQAQQDARQQEPGGGDVADVCSIAVASGLRVGCVRPSLASEEGWPTGSDGSRSEAGDHRLQHAQARPRVRGPRCRIL